MLVSVAFVVAAVVVLLLSPFILFCFSFALMHFIFSFFFFFSWSRQPLICFIGLCKIVYGWRQSTQIDRFGLLLLYIRIFFFQTGYITPKIQCMAPKQVNGLGWFRLFFISAFFFIFEKLSFITLQHEWIGKYWNRMSIIILWKKGRTWKVDRLP